MMKMLPLGSSSRLALAFLVAVLALAVIDSTTAADDLPWLNVHPYPDAYRMSRVGGREGFGVRSHIHSPLPSPVAWPWPSSQPRECRPFCEG
jgi:hypothetical protein